MFELTHALAAGLGALALGVALGWRWYAVRRALAVAQLEQAGLATRLAERDRRVGELQGELARREQEIHERDRELRAEAERRAAAEAALDAERKAGHDKLALLEDARGKLADAFKALSAETLATSTRSFLELARAALEKYQEGAKGDLEKRQVAIAELLGPVRESLAKFESRVGEIERSREHAYGALLDQLKGVAETQQILRVEAAKLVQALRAPQVRGRWGEVQLKRVVELAGMVNFCDFVEQESVTTDSGRLRPDLVIRLPGGKSVVVDAKAPLAAYLDAVEEPDEKLRRGKLVAHARQVRDHVGALSRKTYWEQFQPAPEFVVLFLPGETFFSAALEQDPELLELGADRNVILATPTTLIALLKAVAYGWRQEAIAQNARAVSELGRELHKRLADMGGHLAKLGGSLESAVKAYNAAVGSLEARVLVSARKFRDLEAAGSDETLDALAPLEQAPRRLSAPELVPAREGFEPGAAPELPLRGSVVR